MDANGLYTIKTASVSTTLSLEGAASIMMVTKGKGGLSIVFSGIQPVIMVTPTDKERDEVYVLLVRIMKDAHDKTAATADKKRKLGFVLQ